MKLLNVYLTVAVLLLYLQSFAQKNDSQYPKRLYIGDKVDMESIVFNNVRNYPGGKAKLSDFKGKYIILDFWTKGCSSCIAAFPHMEKLQNQFKDDIQILLVTKNSEEELKLLLKNSPNLKNTTLPVVIGDLLLATQFFPHGPVPYHVWLDPKGKVIATTYENETNSKNLKDLINGKALNLLVRNEILFESDSILLSEALNKKISLLEVDGGNFQKYLKYYAQIPIERMRNRGQEAITSIPTLPYYSMFMSYIPGDIPFGMGFGIEVLKDDSGKPKGFRMPNSSVEKLFRIAFVDPKIKIKKILSEDSAKLFYEDITDTTNLKRHLISNSYCYESSLPYYNIERARALLRLDLSRFFGITGIVEERPLKHIILTRLGNSKEKKLNMKEGNPYKNGNYKVVPDVDGYVFRGVSFQGLQTLLANSNRASDDPIMVDETGLAKEVTHLSGEIIYKDLINIKLKLKAENFHATKANIPILRRELEKYGIGLIEEMRKVKVLVLRTSL